MRTNKKNKTDPFAAAIERARGEARSAERARAARNDAAAAALRRALTRPPRPARPTSPPRPAPFPWPAPPPMPGPAEPLTAAETIEEAVRRGIIRPIPNPVRDALIAERERWEQREAADRALVEAAKEAIKKHDTAEAEMKPAGPAEEIHPWEEQ